MVVSSYYGVDSQLCRICYDRFVGCGEPWPRFSCCLQKQSRALSKSWRMDCNWCRGSASRSRDVYIGRYWPHHFTVRSAFLGHKDVGCDLYRVAWFLNFDLERVV